MAEYSLVARLSANANRFISTIQRAQNEIQRLQSTTARAQNENINIRANTSNIERARGEISSLQNQTNRPLSLRLRDGISSQLSSLRSNINSLAARAHTVAVNVKINGAEKLKGLKSSISEFSEGAAMSMGVNALGVAGIGMSAVSGLQSAMDFEKQMSSVKAVLSGKYQGAELEAAMQELTAQANLIGATTKWTAKEAGIAQYYAALAGWDKEQIIAGVPTLTNLAAATDNDMKLSADMLTDMVSAFGLKAGRRANYHGQNVEESSYLGELLAAVTTGANTDLAQLADSLKYSAPMIGALYAKGTEAQKLQGAQDLLFMTGLEANSALKGSISGTANRTLLTRMAGQNRNTYFGQQLLGVDMVDKETGESRALYDIISDMRQKLFTEGVNLEEFEKAYELMNGQKIQADTRRKLDSFYESAKANGGKITGPETLKLLSMLAGAEAQSSIAAALKVPEDEWQALKEHLDGAKGTLESMSKIQNDNLAGSITLLQSAWDAFQRSLWQGDAGAGLRAFVDSVTDTLSKVNRLFSDGIDFSDFVALGADAVTKLKNKFLELDGIGSLLAGGALMFSLKKIYDISSRIGGTIRELVQTPGSRQGNVQTPPTSPNTQNVGTMNIRANVVNLSGAINQRGGAVQNQQRVNDYYNRRQEILNGRTNSASTVATTSASSTASRIAGAGKTMAKGGALAAVFGALDYLSTLSNSEYNESIAQDEIQKIQAELKALQEAEDAPREQIEATAAALKIAEGNLSAVQKENAAAETQSLFSAGGGVLGAAAGTLLGPLGTLIGGAVGSFAGGKLGELVSKYREKQGEIKPAKSSTVETARKNQFANNAVVTPSTVKTPTVKTAASSTVETAKSSTIETAKSASVQSIAAPIVAGAASVQMPQVQVPEINLREKIGNEIEYVRTQITSFTGTISEFGNSVYTNLATAFESAKMTLSEFGTSVYTNLSSGFESAKTTLSEFGSSIYSSFESAVSAFTSFGESFYSVFESIRAGVATFGSEVYTSVTGSFENLQVTAMTAFSNIGVLIQGGVESARGVITSAFSGAAAEVQGVWNAMPGFFGGLFGGLGGIASAAGSAIASGLNSGIGMIQSAWEGLSGWLSAKISSLSSMAASAAAAVGISIGGNATGTANWRGGLTEVNEHGGELIILPNGEKIMPGNTLREVAKSVEIGHNATGTNFWRGGWTEINERGGEILNLPHGTQILPHATTVRILREQIGRRLNESRNIDVSKTAGGNLRKIGDTAIFNRRIESANVQNIGGRNIAETLQNNGRFNVGIGAGNIETNSRISTAETAFNYQKRLEIGGNSSILANRTGINAAILANRTGGFNAESAFELPALPRSSQVPASNVSNSNSSSTSNNSRVNFNFGGVNISNGMDFDAFAQKLMQMFNRASSNASW